MRVPRGTIRDLTNYSDQLVSFDNLTIRHKQGVLRAAYDYYPYGLPWDRVGAPYDETMAGTELQTGEWGLEGLDLNYFAARYYDPILARWHAPYPLEQCHSPYLAMLGDPANFIDPDGRAGIPFLQDFMKSDGGFILESLAQTVGLVGIGAGYAALVNNLGGIISTAVSIGPAVYSASSSVTTLVGFSSNAGAGGFANSDFSADFTMMKSGRHAGLAFDFKSSKANSSIGNSGAKSAEQENSIVDEPRESKIILKIDFRGLFIKIKKLFGVKEYSNTKGGGFVIERYSKAKFADTYEISETIRNAGWGGKQTYRRTGVSGMVSVDYRSWISDDPNTSEGVNIEIMNNGKKQLITSGTEMNTSTGKDFSPQVNGLRHGGTSWFEAPYDIEITVQPTTQNVQYEINIWKMKKTKYYVRRTRFRKLGAG
jgi:RHS repeat-associated protein